LTVVECPKCSSKFKINKDLLDKERIKMRCSICAHVFTYPLEETSTGSDFDLLIGTSDKELEDKPQLVNEEPFGRGWLIRFRPSKPEEYDSLLDAEAYQKHCEEEKGGH